MGEKATLRSLQLFYEKLENIDVKVDNLTINLTKLEASLNGKILEAINGFKEETIRAHTKNSERIKNLNGKLAWIWGIIIAIIGGMGALLVKGGESVFDGNVNVMKGLVGTKCATDSVTPSDVLRIPSGSALPTGPSVGDIFIKITAGARDSVFIYLYDNWVFVVQGPTDRPQG